MNLDTDLSMPNKTSLYALIATRELDNGRCSEDNIQDFASLANFKESCTNGCPAKLFYLSKYGAINILT